MVVASPLELSLTVARRIALAAQGLTRPRPHGRVDVRHLRRVVDELGLLQLDFVTVLVPSHYLVLFSRLGPFERRRLDDLAYRRRELVEGWARERCLVPMASWPLLAHRRAAHRVRPWGFERFLASHPDYVERVVEAVRERGPLAAGEVPEPPVGAGRWLEHAWYGSVARATLEACFGRGRLAVAGLEANFARRYDLAERVVPAAHRRREVAADEAQRELLRQAARAHGVATAGDLADYFRLPVKETRRRLAELVAAGELEPVRVEGWREPAFLHPAATRPRRAPAAALLSPFDPVVWTRARARRLFDFDYRLEIFTPPAKRRFGAFVLPFLLGDRLVARVDLKADRREGRLRVGGAFLEEAAAADPGAGAVAEALAVELATLAGWLELGSVRVARRGDLARPLAAAIARGSA